MTRPVALVALAAVLLAAGLWWLRDPVWLGGYSYGLRETREDDTGRLFRWTTGLASFYVTASEPAARIDLAGHEWFPVQASIYVDGTLADRVRLDDHWQAVTIKTDRPPTTRRWRRIDIQVARTWGPERLGVRLGWPVGGGLTPPNKPQQQEHQ